MPEYTFADVIIDPEDPRVEIGAEYYFGSNPILVIRFARQDSRMTKHDGVLSKVRKDADLPFVDDDGFLFPCIIRKKEKKYVPFKLSDRDALSKLMGCWLIDKDHGDYYCITAIYPFDERVHIPDYGDVSPEELLENFTFMFDGTPCGEEMEE